jgi:S1-C subfamily serine protease
MRSIVLVLFAGLGLASCQGPEPQDRKALDPRAVEPMKKADAPASKPLQPAPSHPANPHATAPAGESPPSGGSPGMGFMPDYDAGGDGMAIADVRPDGPAAKAGIRAGDVITKFANIPIGDVHDYMAALETVKVGDTVEIVVKRGTETKTLKGTLGVSNR